MIPARWFAIGWWMLRPLRINTWCLQLLRNPSHISLLFLLSSCGDGSCYPSAMRCCLSTPHAVASSMAADAATSSSSLCQQEAPPILATLVESWPAPRLTDLAMQNLGGAEPHPSGRRRIRPPRTQIRRQGSSTGGSKWWRRQVGRRAWPPAASLTLPIEDGILPLKAWSARQGQVLWSFRSDFLLVFVCSSGVWLHLLLAALPNDLNLQLDATTQCRDAYWFRPSTPRWTHLCYLFLPFEHVVR
jgi:hypothetical protein